MIKRPNVLLLFLIFASSVLADNYPKNKSVDVIHYRFHLELNDSTDDFLGSTQVLVQFLESGANEIVLDLIGQGESGGMLVTSVTEGQSIVSFTHNDNQIRIAVEPPAQQNERRNYTVNYRGVPADGLVIADNRHGDRTFSADNWPNKTRHWLPTIDHPYDKATCEFIIEAPHHYQVVANGLKQEESYLVSGRKLTHWKQSVPISTWLMVISVGKYAVRYQDVYKGISIETWVFPQDREAGFFDFARARRPLDFFNTHIGEYPYEKLANVQVTAPVGATEAATAVFYQQDFVTGDRKREDVIAHEIAHHWFGNSLTESDWNDVWLSEGFATYFTLLFNEHTYGRERFVEGLLQNRTRIFEFYEDEPDYRIVHQNLTDMSQVTTRMTYQKGAWILHMLRGIMGDDLFWNGIREYYRIYRDQTVSTDDFQHVMESVAEQDLAWFFQQWLYQGGNLKLEGNYKYDSVKKRIELTLRQVQQDNVLFQMPLEVEVYASEGKTAHKVFIDNRTNHFEIPVAENPEKIVLDPNIWLLMEYELTRN